jgi:hypothetical protein
MHSSLQQSGGLEPFDVSRHILVTLAVTDAIISLSEFKKLFADYDSFVKTTTAGLRYQRISRVNIWFYSRAKIEIMITFSIDWTRSMAYANDRPFFRLNRDRSAKAQVDEALEHLNQYLLSEIKMRGISKILPTYTLAYQSENERQECYRLLSLVDLDANEHRAQTEFVEKSEGLKLIPGLLKELSVAALFATPQLGWSGGKLLN